MSYCRYHPRIAATQFCPHCQINLCASCTDVEADGRHERCLRCDAQTQSLGASVDTEPFWRHLAESFRYPLNTQVGSFIVAISVFSVITAYLPWFVMVGLYLLLTGMIVQFSFNCLSETAAGKMQAPSITSAYSGGVLLVLRLCFALLLMVGAVALIGAKVSPALAAAVGFFLILAAPAMIIIYAMTESLSEALNPLRMLAFMRAIGLAYGVILGILMLMMGSVELLNMLLAQLDSFASLTLQAAVSNYYLIVMFHLMGYMIFQYQHRLGYVAEKDTGEGKATRPIAAKYLSRIQMLSKEGRFDQAAHMYRKALQECPSDEALQQSCLNFTLGLLPQRAEQAGEVLDRYFTHLSQSQQQDKLYPMLTRIRLALPDYLPATPELRHQLAAASLQHGNPKLCVRLLTGLHKSFTDYPGLVAAYQLLGDAMDQLPGMESTADKCRAFAEKLARERAHAPQHPHPAFTQFSAPSAELARPDNAISSEDLAAATARPPAGELPPIEFK